MTVPAKHQWIDPTVLRVEWLESSMLVHAITLTAEPRSPWVHALFGGAVASGIGGAAAAVAGSLVLASVLGVAWVGCVAGLALAAYRVARAAPPTRRRLLIELRAEQVSWTLLEGDRWGMQYQHEIPFPTMSGAATVQTPEGPEVELRLQDGTRRRIVLHGLPPGDADWLAARIEEGIEAAAETALT